MFTIEDCFKASPMYNDLIKKRFDDNFNPANDSRLWLTPGHVVFTTDNTKIHTCDARPYDFSSSPSESESDELLTAVSPILEVFFDTESASTRMFIALMNGDVQIFEYRILLYEWARIGYFNVNIVSPNSNNNHHNVISHVLISHSHNMIMWAEKLNNSDTCYSLNKREIPLNGVREITQSAVGIPLKLIKNCPDFEVIEIRDNICLVPHLPNNINLYVILSARSHIWVFHIDGKLLYRGTVGDSPIDFITLCTKTVGLWCETGSAKVCKLLNNVKNYAYILHNRSLLLIAPNGEISRKLDLGINIKNIKECYVMHNSIFLFQENFSSIHIHSITDGHLFQTLDTSRYSPIFGLWCLSSTIPSFGFYSSHTIYKVNYQSLISMFLSDPKSQSQILNLLQYDHLTLFCIMKNLIQNKFESCDISSVKVSTNFVQTEALLLAILQSCREKGFKPDDFPVKEIVSLILSEKLDNFNPTKLKELLDPLVECFIKYEKAKIFQCQV